jgi:hypothetical protein
MTIDNHFHLTPGQDNPHALQVKRVGDQIHICTNHRCFALNRNMAEQLHLGLTVVLYDNCEVASTETFDRLELETRYSKTLIEGHPSTRVSPMTPTEDDL